MEAHTEEGHEAMKDGAAWESLDYVGVQVLPACQDEPEERVECRNCSCGSTLAKAVA